MRAQYPETASRGAGNVKRIQNIRNDGIPGRGRMVYVNKMINLEKN